MRKSFGVLPNNKEAFLYTISCGGITARITDYGAALQSLLVPDRQGKVSDVVLGYDSAEGYRTQGGCLGATVGRSANRLKGASFPLNGKIHHLTANEGLNNLHSGPDAYYYRLWTLEEETERSVCFSLDSPHGDQGFPGNAHITVT